MILYLSGPISGDPDYQEKFDDAEYSLSVLKGHTVLNPAMLPDGLKEYDDYMNIGYAMLDAADGIMMLPGWKKSLGAKSELRAAILGGKKCFYGTKSVPFATAER